MPLSSWLFGEFTPTSTTLDFFDGVNPQTAIVPQGPRYIHDHTGSRSFLTSLATAMDDQIGSPGTTTIYVREDRRIVISMPDAPGGVLEIDWTGFDDIRIALGFVDDDLDGAHTHVAEAVSPYLWCPGLTEISAGRLGQHGKPTYDTQMGGGGTFTKPVMTTSNYRVNNSLRWNSVINTLADGRVWALSTPSALVGGEHFAFWHTVMFTGGQFTHYRALENDEASTDALTLTPGNRMGPYAAVFRNGEFEYPYDRTIENVEARANVTMSVTQVAEL